MAKYGIIMGIMGKRRKFVSQDHAMAKEGKNIDDRTMLQKMSAVFSAVFFSCALVISISLIAFTIMFFFSEVRGPSMMHFLNPNYVYGLPANQQRNDSVVVNRHGRPSRGDIIIVQDPRVVGTEISSFFIKRLIAIGGDTIYFNRVPLLDNYGIPAPVGNAMYYRFEIQLNGSPIDESYLCPRIGMNVTYAFVWGWLRPNAVYRGPHDIRYVEERGRYEIHVPIGYMFYMGDNRGGSGTPEELLLMSHDSVRLGSQPRSHLVGVVVDVVRDNQSLPAYIWDRFVWFITFRWVR